MVCTILLGFFFYSLCFYHSFRLYVLFNFFRFLQVRLGLYSVLAYGSFFVRVLFSLLVTAWNRAGESVDGVSG